MYLVPAGSVIFLFNYLLHVLIVYSTGVQVVHYLKTCSLVNSKVRYVFLFLFYSVVCTGTRVPVYILSTRTLASRDLRAWQHRHMFSRLLTIVLTVHGQV